MEDEIKKYQDQVDQIQKEMCGDLAFRQLSRNWMEAATKAKYSYNFEWMGRPIIQYPQDILAMQEIIWEIRPDAIVETGIAHGGGCVFYASMLELLGGDGIVIGVEQHIFPEVRMKIEANPMSKRICMLEGDAVAVQTIKKVYQLLEGRQRILLALDSCHTHTHVKKELEAYAPLVQKGSYIVVFDTIVNDVDEVLYGDRPWDSVNNPKTAVAEFLQQNGRFQVDTQISDKLLISACPQGYLKCIANSK